MTKSAQHNFLVLVSLIVTGFVVISLLWPGVSGPFLFDDFSNLNALGWDGSVDNPTAVSHFILDNHSGPFGRPLSMLSFLADGHTWPTSPRPFKITNIFLHLMTGLAVMLMVSRFLYQECGYSRRRADWIALSVACIWVVHPLHLTTVLYIVQRMAILAALFSVLAVYTYLILRKSVKEKKIVKSLAAAAIFIAAFGAGILSKENTILVLFVIAVLELFVLNSVFHDKVIYRLRVAFFFSLGALLTTVVVTKNIWGDGFAMRTFSLDDRILLQLPILGDYISKIVLPFASSLNLFEESFSENSSIYDSNIFLGLTVLSIAAAICSRAILKRNVIVMAAAVWFFGFHLLESTILPLELYFEHRNYLPSIGVIAIIVWGVVFLSDKNDSKILAPIILVSYGLFLSLTTYILSNTWGNETMLYAKFEQDSPESIRAHIAYSQHLEAKGLPELSLGLIQDAVELDPLLFDSVFTEARLRCIFYGEDISSIDWNRNYRVGFGIIGQIQLLDQLEKSYGVTCKDGSRPLLDSLRIEVPKMRLFNESKNLQGPFWDTLSDYYAERLNFEYAATSLENSVAVTNSARGYYKLAVLYASAGLYDSALINARKAIEEDTRRGRFSSSIGGDVYRFIEQIEKIHRRGINYD